MKKAITLRRLACGAALAVTVLGGEAALASPLHLTWYTTNGQTPDAQNPFVWTMDSVPNGFDVNAFYIQPTSVIQNGNIVEYNSPEFDATQDVGLRQGINFNNDIWATDDNFFSGPLSAPIFITGTYSFNYNAGYQGIDVGKTGFMTISSGPSAPAPLVGFGWLSALAAAIGLLVTRVRPFGRKTAQA